jgi:hypothetical protein
MTDTRAFQIIACNRRDGVPAYFFLIDGAVRHSSYDLAGIKAWALGYAGRPVPVAPAPWPTPA